MTKKKEPTTGDRFGAARAKLGISQEKMAQRLAITLRAYRRWENDEGPAPKAYLELAERIAAEKK